MYLSLLSQKERLHSRTTLLVHTALNYAETYLKANFKNVVRFAIFT